MPFVLAFAVGLHSVALRRSKCIPRGIGSDIPAKKIATRDDLRFASFHYANMSVGYFIAFHILLLTMLRVPVRVTRVRVLAHSRPRAHSGERQGQRRYYIPPVPCLLP